MKEIEKYKINTFEDIKHIDEYGNGFWYARELQVVLEYKEWRKLEGVINKAIIACENSKYNVSERFVRADKTLKMPNNAKKKIKDYKLSRYACYLIVQNADPRKEVIALGQTYFAIQTIKQELSELEYLNLDEDERRIYKRNKTRKANYFLQQTAKKAGVKNYDKFHNYGYKGLYNGETADDIAKRKKLRYREEILDNMCSEELAANEFRITQAEAKLKRDSINKEGTANKAHFKIGKIVRNAIKQAGGTMPENLSTPHKSLKELGKEEKRKTLTTNTNEIN